jgi:hypothetical protein
MPLRIAPFQPSNEDKARINAVAEAIAVNRLYRPVNAPLVSAATQALVRDAGISVGADPIPERQRQKPASAESAEADRHARAYIRLSRQVLSEVQAGRGGEFRTQQLAQKAQEHELEMRQLSGERADRRSRDGSTFQFKHAGQQLAFTLRLNFGPTIGHLYAWSEALSDLDDDARRSLGRWASSVSPEERGMPGPIPERAELIYRLDRGSLTLRSTVATKYPGLAQALHLLALSAWPVEVHARSD